MDEAEYSYDSLDFPLWGQSIPVAIEKGTDGKVVWVPVRLVCEMVGVDRKSQSRYLQSAGNHDRFGQHLRQVPFKAKGVWRPYICLHRSRVPRWLDDINPRLVPEDAAIPLSRFQEMVTQELDRIAFKYRGQSAERGIIQSHYVHTTVFVCDCGRHWRIVDEDGERYVEKLETSEV